MKSNLILKAVLALAILSACDTKGGKTVIAKGKGSKGPSSSAPFANIETNGDPNTKSSTGARRDPKTNREIPGSDKVTMKQCLNVMAILSRLMVEKAAFSPAVVSSYDLDFTSSAFNVESMLKKQFDPSKVDALRNAILPRILGMKYFEPVFEIGLGSQIAKSNGFASISRFFADLAGQEDCSKVKLQVVEDKTEDAKILYYSKDEIRFIDRSNIGRTYIVRPDSIILRLSESVGSSNPETCNNNIGIQRSFVITVGDDVSRLPIKPNLINLLAKRSKAKLLKESNEIAETKISSQIYQLVVSDLVEQNNFNLPPNCPESK